jgi:Ca2+-binding RTX toxin-like protein
VTKPAEQVILDNWQTAWGPRPASVSSYQDMLMGDDYPNYNRWGEYQLNGRNGNDIIFGFGGDDYIEGGKGSDTLIGGEGNDTYIYSEINGDGNDTIVNDHLGNDKIMIEKLNGKIVTISNIYQSGTNKWTTATGDISLTHNSPWQIVLEDGSTIQLGEDFESGDFGINLLDTPTDPTTTLTITGDLAPLNDPAQYDALGNVIVDPNTPAPGRNDTLFGSTGNDLIEGKGGSDIIYGQGGSDWILGGSGRDGISTGVGSDIIEGGTEGDLILGGVGDDQLFGEIKDDMDDLVTAGEEATNINAQGDLVSGQDGNDFIYGSNANDALFGGAGRKDSVERIAWSVENKGKAKLQGISLSAMRSMLCANKLFLTTDYPKNYNGSYFTTAPSYAAGFLTNTSLRAHHCQR